jgi:hypothetical protein
MEIPEEILEFTKETSDQLEETSDIKLSLCGQYLNKDYIQENRLKESEMFEIFMAPTNLLSFETYSENPD